MKVRLAHCLNVLSSFILAVAILSSSLVPARPVQAAKLAQEIPAVTMLTPADGSTIYASTAHARALPTFTWEAVPGAKSYRLEINTNLAFDGTMLVAVTTIFNRWTPTVANLPDNTDGLYWRVRVQSMTGQTGSGPWPDSPFQFVKNWLKTNTGADNQPELLAPANDAVMAFTNSPTFSWTPVLGASYYYIQFSLDPDFATVKNQFLTINTTYQFVNKLVDGTYYWRVVPMQDGTPDWTGKVSEIRRIVFNYNSAYAPTLVSPANGSHLQFTPTFRWNPVIGAEVYTLEYSTDPTLATKTPVSTSATSYTPTAPLRNDQDYYWRVRVQSGSSENTSDYSPVWQFRKDWTPPITLLTPTNGFQYAWDAYFSWAPVPGASAYTIEIDKDISLNTPTGGTTTNTFYVHRITSRNCPEVDNVVYWRVIPLDSSGNAGDPSATWTFNCYVPLPDPTNPYGAPVQVYPNYYYNPITDPPMDPHEDNTAPLPVFLWKRALSSVDLSQAPAYRIQVGTSAGFGSGTVLYTFDTENMNAVPTQISQLPHGSGQTDYFWRVRPLAALGGAETGRWSQIWRMRHNPALQPAATTSIQPLRPAVSSEWVETVPLFEWMPLQSATSYQVQISLNSDMSSPLGTYATEYPAYSHPYRLAPATYYWRVQGMNGATPLGWSTPIRFQIAMQSRWRSSRTLGVNNTTVVATDPPSGETGEPADATYDLTNLYITQGGSNWYIGFNAGAGADMRYAVYIDADHVNNSGAGLDPLGYDVTTIPAHRPEAVIYIDKIGGVFSAGTTRVYNWNSIYNIWNPPQFLNELAGTGITYDSGTGYLELTVRGSYVGQTTEANSMAVSVFSVPFSGGEPQDSVPSDPIFAPGYTGSNTLSRFVSVTDRVVLITPPYKVTGDPKVFSTVPAFVWQPEIEVPEIYYHQMRYGVDPLLSSWDDVVSTNPASYTFFNDIRGDNTYYWQVLTYYTNKMVSGWSQPGKMERRGRPALGLTMTPELWFPVLSWTMTEGADTYRLEIDDNAEFASPVAISTALNTYTPNTTSFFDGVTYYARVRTNRTSGVNNGYSNAIAFTVQRPQVTGLHTYPEMTEGSPARYNPTYCWNPIPSAWKYRLEISWDSTFLTPYDSVTTEENCYTFPTGELDGSFFWRVMMMDGTNKYGPPSAQSQAWKYYPSPTPLEPLDPVVGTPIFKWTPVDGADRYRIQISNKPDFSVIKYTATTVNTEHQPTSNLNFGDYYWRVQIIDHNNVNGPFSDFVFIEFYKVFLPYIRK